MQPAALPSREQARLDALRRYDILDSHAEVAYDELTALASHICRTPIALISLVDAHRQWFKAKVGLAAAETPRDVAFCAHAILGDDIFVVADTLKDERFADNPLVTDQPNIRFYAGAPLVTSDGFALGTLCAIDRKPRELSADQVKALKTLAHQVVVLLDLRMAFKQSQRDAEELHQLNASKDRFFRLISHDLRAPFNGILGMAEILANDCETLRKEEIKAFAGDILTTAQQAYDLVENLLEWSQLETGTMPCKPVRINVDELLSRVGQMLTPNASRKQINLQFVSAGVSAIQADPNMLYSVLQNLIGNAIKFSPPQGRIVVTTKCEAGRVVVTVSDTGVGMVEDQLKNLFKVDSSRTTTGTAGENGTGLGLLLCKQFIERNGGQIQVTSELDKGSIFVVTFPAVV